MLQAYKNVRIFKRRVAEKILFQRNGAKFFYFFHNYICCNNVHCRTSLHCCEHILLI